MFFPDRCQSYKGVHPKGVPLREVSTFDMSILTVPTLERLPLMQKYPSSTNMYPPLTVDYTRAFILKQSYQF